MTGVSAPGDGGYASAAATGEARVRRTSAASTAPHVRAALNARAGNDGRTWARPHVMRDVMIVPVSAPRAWRLPLETRRTAPWHRTCTAPAPCARLTRA